ncbi:hypothetical protein FA09DRAFT_327511 [Tilletiopsis washingtonensis]|uniref:GDP/GTP exchange factor Sec2 N-terminal domain-containing protein n=1 Tax=Tilletiopsis washingtonensis TaxID=58919 RepID=A0A316ZGY8_9BASI|nr:hypothetical protein FA09DRAFT_327511 [Tilletiopsis washingtonensis]PWO00782.1 hypothetical protein FA09DRAFT_327511 [Tilletiopsis washingtonensis]
MAPRADGTAHEHDDDEQAVATPDLTRLDPDAILADDADPEALLGAESDSEAGGLESRRASRVSAAQAEGAAGEQDGDAVAAAARALQSQSAQPATPEAAGRSGAAARLASPMSETPTQHSFRIPDASPPQTPDAELAALRLQVSDLSGQVMSLNSKLVSSYDKRSDLEDEVSEAHSRIMAHTTRIAELEKERQEHLAALNTGLLVEKAHVSSEMQKMMERVIEETAQRGRAVSDKEKIESELDELSASLFSEANAMVANERLARARAEEKSQQMEERLKDTEGIMLEQQKILGNLQREVEQLRLTSSHDEQQEEDDGKLHVSALVRTPSQRAPSSGYWERRVSVSPGQDEWQLNIVPYQELRSFLEHLRRLRKGLAPFYNYPLHDPPSLASPRNVSGMPASPGAPVARTSSPAPHLPSLPLSFGGLGSGSASYNASSSTSPFVAAGVTRHRDYPMLPSNAEQLVHIPGQSSLPFIKRAQEEDSDPTLRFDFAPGLNWLSRRQANTAVLEGSLVIEPVFPGGSCPDEEAVRRANAHLPPAACSMCGIPVVNVPLPGGGHAESNTAAATAAGWISAAGTAAQQLGVAAKSESSNKDGTSTPKTRTGLFSTLRSMGSSSPRPSVSSATSSTGAVGDSPGGPQSEADGETPSGQLIHVDGPSAPLAVPTHIFRISETSTARYLLCPHHCLARLRAACAFWGYLRSIERAVVLEGKLAWDDPPQVAAALPPPPPPRSPKPVEAPAEETAAKSDSASADAATLKEPESAGDAETPQANTEGAEEAAESPERASGTATPSGTNDGDSFVDADDAPAEAAPDSDAAAPSNSTEEAAAGSGALEAPSQLTASSSSDAGGSSPKPPAPPLPKRSNARRPVPPPPAARKDEAGLSAAAAPATPGSATVAPRRVTLPVAGGADLVWEERVWQEVMRLKTEMWRARSGLSSA